MKLAIALLLVAAFGGNAADYWAENHSTSTTCAEEDNVNVPIFAPGINRILIVATHPSYCPCAYGCPEDWSGCGSSAAAPWKVRGDACPKIFDDHAHNAVYACMISEYWRGQDSTLSVRVNGQTSYDCHYLQIRRWVPGTDSWPEVFVLYEDGNMRIKPHPPEGYTDVCFGSSMIIGPATLGDRPYAEVESVDITTGASSVQLDITFAGGETAHIDFTVDRARAIADATVIGFPDHVAVFRSMWVTNGNADVDSVETAAGKEAILGGWSDLEASAWFFHRQYPSTHNTSAPDIRVVLDTSSTFRVDETGTVYADGDLRSAAIATGAADVAEWVSTIGEVEPGDVLELDRATPGVYRRSTMACSPFVAGVASTAPGVILGGAGRAAGDALLALAGIVPVRVTDEGGSILPGDLLVTSSMPGHAMRWAGRGLCPCAFVGKALESLQAGTGVILVLLARL